ncbi:MAG: hypothetical protein WCG16_09805 [Methylococcales bacterium]
MSRQIRVFYTIPALLITPETFVLCASIALGLLQFISLNFDDKVWLNHQLYLRTKSRDLPSEKTTKQVLMPMFLKQFFQVGKNTITEQIWDYLLTVSNEIDSD